MIEKTAIQHQNYQEANSLHFGQLFDGLPEVKVYFGILGIEFYLLDITTNTYNQTYSFSVRRYELTSCHNRSEVQHMLLVGKLTLEDFIDLGYDNLEYVDYVARFPALVDFVDNPGLLTIMIERLLKTDEGIIPISIDELVLLNRRYILNTIYAYQGVAKKHLRWLSKVKPEKNPISTLAWILEESLLSECEEKYGRQKGEKLPLDLQKLANHQPKWRYQGLAFFSNLLGRKSSLDRNHHVILDLLNIDDHSSKRKEFLNMVDEISKLLKNPPPLPEPLLASLHEICSKPFESNPDLVVHAYDAFIRWRKENNDYILYLLLFNDNHIPLPLLSDNHCVKHLGSRKEMQRHALKQKNCIFSTEIINKVVNQSIDLYKFEGNSKATIAINRIDYSIDGIEATGLKKLNIADFLEILSWYLEAMKDKQIQKQDIKINPAILEKLKPPITYSSNV